jgi:putative DNA primase/helicase
VTAGLATPPADRQVVLDEFAERLVAVSFLNGPGRAVWSHFAELRAAAGVDDFAAWRDRVAHFEAALAGAPRSSSASPIPRADLWETGADPGDPRREGGRLAVPRLRVYSGTDLLTMTLAEREALLVTESGEPVLRRQDLWMIAGQRGAGKTWLVGSLGVALATGGACMRWRAPARRRVVLVDGEMPARALQERLRLLAAGADLGNLSVIAQDLQDPPLPSLATMAGVAMLEPAIEGADVLLLDNRSTLVGSAAESDSDDWYPVQQWLLSLRRRGITVILADHAGRNGLPRGTSRREDILDVVLLLKRPADYRAEEGARIDLAWSKARGLTDGVVTPCELRLRVEDGRAEWDVRDVTGRDYAQAAEMYAEGASPVDVASDLGVSRATAYRWRAQARRDGRLPARGRR